VFSVSDTGPGIGPAEQARIFEPYVRGAEAPYRGTGLGLSIARGIVEALGGRLWVVSRRGKGATFRFTLPLADLATASPACAD
jgi:signal transduction histidine kinase